MSIGMKKTDAQIVPTLSAQLAGKRLPEPEGVNQ